MDLGAACRLHLGRLRGRRRGARCARRLADRRWPPPAATARRAGRARRAAPLDRARRARRRKTHPRHPSASGTGRSRKLIWPLAIFVVLAALFAFALRSGDPSRLPSALIGKPAPAIALAAPGRPDRRRRPRPRRASAERRRPGEVSVVNFWASWCGPCVQEHPQLVALKERRACASTASTTRTSRQRPPLPRPLRQPVRRRRR